MTGLPTTEQWQAMLADHVHDMTEVINMVESQRGLLQDYRREITRTESCLSDALARERKLRLELRQLASRWSRRGPQKSGWATSGECTWVAAEQELSAILDADQ